MFREPFLTAKRSWSFTILITLLTANWTRLILSDIKKKKGLFSLLWVLVFVICSPVECKLHFQVSARYSHQRANKNNLTVNVYSWEQKTEWRHSIYVSESNLFYGAHYAFCSQQEEQDARSTHTTEKHNFRKFFKLMRIRPDTNMQETKKECFPFKIFPMLQWPKFFIMATKTGMKIPFLQEIILWHSLEDLAKNLSKKDPK